MTRKEAAVEFDIVLAQLVEERKLLESGQSLDPERQKELLFGIPLHIKKMMVLASIADGVDVEN